MARILASLAVVVAAVGVVAGPAAAASAPAPVPVPVPVPGELWSRFPLEPRNDTSPTETQTSTPRPVASSRQIVTPIPDSSEGSPTLWIALGMVGVAAVAAASAVGYKRRARTSERPAPARQRKPMLVAPHEPSTRRSVAPPEPATHPSEPSLVEMLSPRLHLDEQAEPAEQGASEPALPAPAPPAPTTCEIRWWRGYVTARFYVEAEPPLPYLIESPAFRAHGRTPPAKNSSAMAAYEVVVRRLEAAGWKPDGHGTLWFHTRFKRVQVGAGSTIDSRVHGVFDAPGL